MGLCGERWFSVCVMLRAWLCTQGRSKSRPVALRVSQDEDCGAAFSCCVRMWDVGFFPGKASCGEYQSYCAVAL